MRKRMLVLDPGNGHVLLLRGKAALESDDPKSAIGYLEKAPDLDSHPEGLCALLKAYLQTGNSTKATPLAKKLLTVHNDSEGLFLLAEGCARLGEYHEALDVYTQHADRLLATDSTKLLASLHTMISHVRADSRALDELLLLLNKAAEPLLGALPQAPRDVRLNQRLAALHTRFQRFTEAAVCCRTLESVYHDAGYPDEAVRFGELAARYEQNAEAAPLTASLPSTSARATASSASAASVAPAPWPTAASAAPGHEIAAAAHPEFAIQELSAHAPSSSDAHDISSELSSDLAP